jgi:AcrR family transcriptional regulator
MGQRKAAREYQLLEVAPRLFKDKGYHNTSMQDLADAFGVQKANLYDYIDSKEELLRRLRDGTRNTHHATYLDWRADPARTPD